MKQRALCSAIILAMLTVTASCQTEGTDKAPPDTPCISFVDSGQDFGTPDAFRVGYPSWMKVEALRDPRVNSDLWRRVTDS